MTHLRTLETLLGYGDSNRRKEAWPVRLCTR